MTRTKAVSLLLAVVLMLTVATVALTPARQPLASTLFPDQGNLAAVMVDNTPARASVLACAGCSGGGSGGG